MTRRSMVGTWTGSEERDKTQWRSKGLDLSTDSICTNAADSRLPSIVHSPTIVLQKLRASILQTDVGYQLRLFQQFPRQWIHG